MNYKQNPQGLYEYVKRESQVEVKGALPDEQDIPSYFKNEWAEKKKRFQAKMGNTMMEKVE